MDYKEEYQKALERAKKGLPLDEVFPELKESEDERIRKALIKQFSAISMETWAGVPKIDIISWLEKQKEQQPAEWSEEDEKIFNSLCTVLHGGLSSIPTEKFISWLKSLRPQPKQEWSEEDKEMFDRCVANAKKHIPIPDKNGHLDKIEERVDKELVDWLKERFFNVHWKPSEEQMKALNEVVHESSMQISVRTKLILLEDGLKKLM